MNIMQLDIRVKSLLLKFNSFEDIKKGFEDYLQTLFYIDI